MSGVANLLMALMSGAPGVIHQSLPGGTAVGPGIATWQLNNDGSTTISPGVTTPWVNPATSGIAALYQVKVDATSGTFTVGTTGTWLDMSSNNGWTKDSGDVTFTVSFREKATGIVRSVQTNVVLQVT